MTKPGIFTADLLKQCISCGFCLPACPTYRLTGEEQSSPRGRIDLMRALELGELPEDDPTLLNESSFCLGCRACEPVCPAGVQYGELLEEWRAFSWRRRRPLKLRLLLWVTRHPVPIRALGSFRRHARARATSPDFHLLLGCFERVLFPRVSRNAAALVPSVSVSTRQGCCGALQAHNGDLESGREMARELGEQLQGTILTTSGGCAAHLASVLGGKRVKELSEWLVEARAAFTPLGKRPRVALQDSCHLRYGKGVWEQPRLLLEQLSEYVELPSTSECCGAAGTYAILRKKDSRRVLKRKLQEIADADLDYVVVTNPGCLRQLQQALKRLGSKTHAIHLADFLALSAVSVPMSAGASAREAVDSTLA